MQVDWESSHEPNNLDEAITQDIRMLNDMKDTVGLPTITSQLNAHINEAQAAFDDSMEEDNLTDELDGEKDHFDNGKFRKSKNEPPKRMYFSESDLDELLNQQCNELKFVYDKALCEKVWQRADFLRKLKTKLEHVALECHQLDEINAYIKICLSQTNFDLTHEVKIAKEKLCLMQDALKIGMINNQEDQGLVASEVYLRVQKMAERESK